MNVNSLIAYVESAYDVSTGVRYRLSAMVAYMEQELQSSIDADYIRFYFPGASYK